MTAGPFGDMAFGPLQPRSPQAAAIAHLFASTLFVCGAVFLLVTVLVGFCVLRFPESDSREPSTVEGSTRLEVAWTIAPALVLIVILALTARAMAASDPPVDRGPDVTVIGHQWWWEARYPSGLVTANEIHIPTHKALVVRLESADVVHDFWVPELGRKMDATPGRPTEIWLEADQPGTYGGACAEYCGLQHAWMRIRVVAESAEEFRQWERSQLAPPPRAMTDLTTRGAALFDSMTCSSCHSLGTGEGRPKFGPDLTHLAARATLGAGVLDNTPANLTRWLLDPQAVKAGCHMPNLRLTDAQAADLVAYFQTLR